MASMKFIVEDDQPKELTFMGDTTDALALTTYLIGKIYAALGQADPDAAEAYRRLMSMAIADKDSPVWNLKPREGETVVAIRQPEEDDGSV